VPAIRIGSSIVSSLSSDRASSIRVAWVDRRVGRPGRGARHVQPRDEAGVVRPVQERPRRDGAAWMIGRPLVDVRLAGVLEREPALVQRAGEADRVAQLVVKGLVSARSGLAASELAR
jgi:hypothetical protein